MSKQKKVDIKDEFYEIYSDIDRTAGLPKAKKQRLERLRNQMAVDFYNLKEDDDNDISEFAEKYTYRNYQMPNDKGTLGEQWVRLMIGELKNRLYNKDKGYKLKEHEELLDDFKEDQLIRTVLKHHEMFKTIVDNIIDVKKIPPTQIAYIKNKYYGQITQDFHEGRYRLHQTAVFPLASSWVLERALYEWVMLLSRGMINVNRCEENTCQKLYIPTAKGREQKYCSNACKMRSYRRQSKKVLLDS